MNALNIKTYQEKKTTLFDQLAMGFLAAIVVGLCAQLRLYFPFSPVPFVMQNSLVIFFAALLGRRGALMMASTLIAQGAMGLPVFASGYIGLAAFVGPTGGYLIGYVVAAYVVGMLYERRSTKTPLRLFLDMSIGHMIVLFFGAIYLSTIVGGLGKAVIVGVLPYIVTDVMKSALLTTLFFGMTAKRNEVF